MVVETSLRAWSKGENPPFYLAGHDTIPKTVVFRSRFPSLNRFSVWRRRCPDGCIAGQKLLVKNSQGVFGLLNLPVLDSWTVLKVVVVNM